MKKRSSRRFIRSAKWVGLLLILLVLAADSASTWWLAHLSSRSLCANVFAGQVLITVNGIDGPLLDAYVRPAKVGFAHVWWFQIIRPPGPENTWLITIPLWFFAVSLALPTSVAWYLERRASRAGVCPKCSYDLSATPAGSRCPECGAGAGEARPRSG